MSHSGKEESKGKWPSDLILELYSSLLAEMWEIVSALVGEAILGLLFASAILQIGQKHPFLLSLRVSEEGIAFEGVNEKCRTMAPLEIHQGFHSLVNHLFHLFSVLTVGVINKELFPRAFPRLKEAERIISQSRGLR
ncbi:MAG: hypothetical protein A2170_15540 [Deltaproteobacteria bacterium RBG_13_53_10]|nr:MAG: hypothetical protein A2170_15540 [Deltaproteobacteria bacterium RBG_13_53_10]